MTRTLRDLERNGLIHRQVYPVVPSKVEYSLTSLGTSLSEVTKNLCDWSINNFEQVTVAQQNFDNVENNIAK